MKGYFPFLYLKYACMDVVANPSMCVQCMVYNGIKLCVLYVHDMSCTICALMCDISKLV